MEEELFRDIFAQCLTQWVPGFYILLYYKEQTRSITTLQSLYFRIIVQAVMIKPVVKWDFSLVLHMYNLKLNPQTSQEHYSYRGSRWSEFRGQIISGRKSGLWGFLCFTHIYIYIWNPYRCKIALVWPTTDSLFSLLSWHMASFYLYKLQLHSKYHTTLMLVLHQPCHPCTHSLQYLHVAFITGSKGFIKCFRV